MWQEELVHELESVTPSQRRTVLADYREKTGHSITHLYRIATRFGFKTKRPRRSDTGTHKSGLTEKQILLISGLLQTTAREVKGPIMPVERALEIAVDSDYIDEGKITPGGMQRILRNNQINAASLSTPAPSIRMRSLHPNHCHVFDVSVCIQYYLKDKGLAIMDERDFYKNKLHNYAKTQRRLLRYLIVDHFSGMFYLRYYEAAGESENNLFAFLKEAWKDKNDPRYPFRGCPFYLLMDAGSANRAAAVAGFLKRLDVEVPRGKPYNAQRQGAVEVMHNFVERWFESGLRLQPACDLNELNAQAYDSMVKLNALHNHTRTGMPRTQLWLTVTKEQLRELPDEDILNDLFARPEEERTVMGDLTISYRGNTYLLKHIEGIFRGAHVLVILKPFKWPAVDIAFQGTLYEASPLEALPGIQGGFPVNAAIIGQEYKSQPETVTQQAVKRFENMAYGEEGPGKDRVPFEGLKVFGHHADKVDLTYIQKKGTPMEIDHAITEKHISFTEFLKRLAQRVGAISKELNQSLRAEFGDSIEIHKAEEVIDSIEQGAAKSAESREQRAESRGF